MKYLLDTVAWLWSVHADERLGDKAREILANGEEEIYLSAASSWELSIKMRLGKLNFPGATGASRTGVHGEARSSRHRGDSSACRESVRLAVAPFRSLSTA